MSSELDLLEKRKNSSSSNVCDSGFVSYGSSFCDSCSMKVADSPPIHSCDYVKDLQAEYEDINNFDEMTIHEPNDNDNCNIAKNSALQMAFFMDPVQFYEQNNDGDTHLHLALIVGYIDSAIWLIDRTSRPSLLDIRNDDNQTALHLAALTKQSRVLRRLVLASSDTTIRTSDGNTAMHIACEAEDFASVVALTEPLNDEELNWLTSRNRMAPVLGKDLELRNYDGVTPMHAAIKKGNLDIVKQLVKVGAEVNTVDPRSGYTSLHLAINNERRNIVEFMAKEHSSCINVPSRFGASTYEIALDLDKKLAEDLVKWGAEPIVRDTDSESSCDDSDSEECACSYLCKCNECNEFFPISTPYQQILQGPKVALLST